MNLPIRSILAALAAAALLCGCNDPWDYPPDISCREATPDVAPPAWAGVPDTLSVCGGRYVPGCELWRDFMPMLSPPNGTALMALVSLTELDSLTVPDGLVFDHLWVLDGAAFWSTGFIKATPDHPAPGRIENAAGCGPKWDPGLLVDVIVSVRCGGGEAQYVRLRDVTIGRTE